MKFFLSCLVAILAAFNVANCLFSSESEDTNNLQYVQYLKQRNQLEAFRRKFTSLCPDKEDELDEALIQLKTCTDEIDYNAETACSAIQHHFLRCSKPLTELLESCLPKESKGVPKAIFESLNAGSSYLCKTDGEHIFELANSCIFKNNIRTMRCERRIKTKLQQYKKKPISKTDLCEFAQSMKPCLHNHLQESCGHRITSESFMGLFDALISPCKNVNTVQIEHNDINEVELLD